MFDQQTVMLYPRIDAVGRKFTVRNTVRANGGKNLSEGLSSKEWRKTSAKKALFNIDMAHKAGYALFASDIIPFGKAVEHAEPHIHQLYPEPLLDALLDRIDVILGDDYIDVFLDPIDEVNDVELLLQLVHRSGDALRIVLSRPVYRDSWDTRHPFGHALVSVPRSAYIRDHRAAKANKAKRKQMMKVITGAYILLDL